MPWIDAKYYAGTQTMDEARHVEVFSRYLREKLEWEWPINESLKELLDATIQDARWDFKYLGMQIIIEGLAMAAFGNLFQVAQEPLLKELLRYVMKDESRHVAFGVLSLKDYYADMPENEMRDREDFVIYACELMRNRLVGDQIARVMGWNQAELRDVVMTSPLGSAFRRMLFARVVPNLKRLGLHHPARARGLHQARHHRVRGLRPRPSRTASSGSRSRARLQSEQLEDLLGRPAHHGPIAVHQDRALEQLGMLRDGVEHGVVIALGAEAGGGEGGLATARPFASRAAEPAAQLGELRARERILEVETQLEAQAALLEQRFRRARLRAARVVDQEQGLAVGAAPPVSAG